MEATRARMGSAIEWALATTFVVVSVAIGSIALREFRTVTAVMPVIAHESTPSVAPSGVPARAVSVPVLLLADGRAVKVGDSAGDVAAQLGREAEVGTQTIERTSLGNRLTRLYELGEKRFFLVFEALQKDAEPRVAGIYLQ